MSTADLIDRRSRALGPSYKLFYDEPVHLVRGEGVWLTDAAGRKYLDCYNNVASVGHCHPHVVAALAHQAATLNTHTRYLHDNVVDYAERLTATLPGDLSACLFVCTGTEANDLAMRIARVVTGNHGAIVSEHSYHGNTTLVTQLSTDSYPAAERPDWLAVIEPPNTYRGTYRAGEPDIGLKYAQFLDGAIEELKSRRHKPAAFMVDMIFDSNGALVGPDGYYKAAFDKVRAAGGLCIADEVQSGFCRTGNHWWGFQNFDVMPDIVTLGKPMGAGHPLAAVVTTPAIAAAFAEKFSYFNTFGGNPVSTAVGMAVLDVLENENILDNVKTVGAHVAAGFEALMLKHDLIGDSRGLGLFRALEIVSDRATRKPDAQTASLIANRMRDAGVLLSVTGPHKNVIKVRPPMVFSEENTDQMLETLDQVMSGL